MQCFLALTNQCFLKFKWLEHKQNFGRDQLLLGPGFFSWLNLLRHKIWTACQPKTCLPFFCRVNPEKPPEVVIGSALLFEALSKTPQGYRWVWVVRHNPIFLGNPLSRKTMKPICGKGKRKNRKGIASRPKPVKISIDDPLLCMSWTEDHVMVAALVEGGTFMWFSGFFHEGKLMLDSF